MRPASCSPARSPRPWVLEPTHSRTDSRQQEDSEDGKAGKMKASNKMPSAAKLSTEGEELRRLFQQDIRDSMGGGGDLLLLEMQTMRREMKEFIEHSRTQSASLLQARDSSKQEAELLHSQLSAAVDLLSQISSANPHLSTEIRDVLNGVGLAPSKNGLFQQPFPTSTAVGEGMPKAGGLSTAQGVMPPHESLARRSPRELPSAAVQQARAKALDADMENVVLPPPDVQETSPVSPMAVALGEHQETPPVAPGDDRHPGLSKEATGGLHSDKSRSSTDPRAVTNLPTGVSWEWERSNNKGWAPYQPAQIKRIESAWRKGASRVRLKSGAEGKTPMEIFLVDMLQLDPVSGNTRKVRRLGPRTRWSWIERHFKAILSQVKTGEPRWETFEHYKSRQEAYLGLGTIDTLRPMVRASTVMQLKDMQSRPRWKQRMSKIGHSDVFGVITMIVTFMQVIWIAIDVDANEGLILYDKPSGAIVLEFAFLTFFAFDLIAHWVTYMPSSAAWGNSWFCFDFICVVGSLLETLVIPPLNWLSNQAISDWNGFGALRIMRLAKVARVWKIFSASSDAAPFFKGLLSGMRSAAFIWAIIFGMLFFFGVLLRLYSTTAIASTYCDNLWQAMGTLIVRGIFLDEVGQMLDDMSAEQDFVSMIIFLVFVWVTFFNLLNMLVGTFCSVAGDVSVAEKDSADVEFLRSHLQTVVECYLRDATKIGKQEFELIMKNADVHRTLRQCGTDMEELKALETLLFHDKEEIEFDYFFKAITHLRKGKIATVKDVMQLQDAVGASLHAIKDVLQNGLQISEGDRQMMENRFLELARHGDMMHHGSRTGTPSPRASPDDTPRPQAPPPALHGGSRGGEQKQPHGAHRTQ